MTYAIFFYPNEKNPIYVGLFMCEFETEAEAEQKRLNSDLKNFIKKGLFVLVLQ